MKQLDKGLISKIYSSSYISIPNKQTNKKVGKQTLTDISPKKTYRWLTSTLKDAQHHSLLEKCKSTLQWDITSHRSEWPSSKSLQTINTGEGVEKREHSCTVLIDIATMEGSMEIPLKTRNKTTIWHNNPTPRHIPWRNQNWKRHRYPMVHCSTIYNS